MKTIDTLLEMISLMERNQLPVNIEVGSFRVKTYGSLANWAGRLGCINYIEISFELSCCYYHLQHLIGIGVGFKKDELYAKKQIKGFTPNNNDMLFSVTCSAHTLSLLAKYSRYNHLRQVSLDNDYHLAQSGWVVKTRWMKSNVTEKAAVFAKKIRSFTQRKIEEGRKKYGSAFTYEMTPLQRKCMAKIYNY